jgi:hypothetical protein
MKLRWKLFFFLFGLQPRPLAVVTGIHRQGTRNLGAVIGEG